jgi:hypothetical protein
LSLKTWQFRPPAGEFLPSPGSYDSRPEISLSRPGSVGLPSTGKFSLNTLKFYLPAGEFSFNTWQFCLPAEEFSVTPGKSAFLSLTTWQFSSKDVCFERWAILPPSKEVFFENPAILPPSKEDFCENQAIHIDNHHNN